MIENDFNQILKLGLTFEDIESTDDKQIKQLG